MAGYLEMHAPYATGDHTWHLPVACDVDPPQYLTLDLLAKPVIHGGWQLLSSKSQVIGQEIIDFVITLKSDRIARHIRYRLHGAGVDEQTDPQLAYPPSELATGPGGPIMVLDCEWEDRGATIGIVCHTDVFCWLQCLAMPRWPEYVLTTEIKRGVPVPGCPQLSYAHTAIQPQSDAEHTLSHGFEFDPSDLSPDKLVYFRGLECDRPSPSLSPPIRPRPIGPPI